jgi:benzoate membrane transport protein
MPRVSAQALGAGVLAGFVGSASSFAVVVQGLVGVGASPAEAASGLMALSLAMGVCGIFLSLWKRMPISVAWSTPGAALLATAGVLPGGFSEAVGAFIVSSALIVVAGLWRPLGRAVAAIPPPLANGMLAGVLLALCLAPMRAVAEAPAYGLAIVVTWAVVARLKRVLAVPAAVLVTVGLVVWSVDLSPMADVPLVSAPILIVPTFSFAAFVGIALPLFIVTMASQNVPGIAVLNANGFHPEPGPLFTVTGLFSLAAAPFGAHAVNLAAITAAMCAGEEAHPDPARRLWAGVASGVVYLVIGLFAGVATAFLAASPQLLIQAVAGLALFGAFGAALFGATRDPASREAAVITFLTTASGLAFFGIGGAFWGLVAGGLVLSLQRFSPSLRR